MSAISAVPRSLLHITHTKFYSFRFRYSGPDYIFILKGISCCLNSVPCLWWVVWWKKLMSFSCKKNKETQFKWIVAIVTLFIVFLKEVWITFKCLIRLTFLWGFKSYIYIYFFWFKSHLVDFIWLIEMLIILVFYIFLCWPPQVSLIQYTFVCL